MNQEEKRSAWLQERRAFACGTDVSRIMRASRYGGPVDVYLEKKGLAPKKKSSLVQTRGQILEPALLGWYSKQTGHDVLHPDDPIIAGSTAWHGASLDGYARTGDIEYMVVDAKTSRDRDEWGASGSCRVPIEVEIQMRWYMPILEHHLNQSGVDGSCVRAVLPTYFPLQDEFCLFYVDRDLEVEERMVNLVDEWWKRHIVKGHRPEIDASKAASLLLEGTYDSNQALPRRESSEAEEGIAWTLQNVKQQIKDLQEQQRLLENRLKECIGPAKGIYGKGFKLSWGWQKAPARLNTKRLRADHPDIVSEYTESADKPVRVFRTTFKTKTN